VLFLCLFPVGGKEPEKYFKATVWTVDGLGQKGKDMKFREFMALQLFAEDEGTGAESNGSGVNGEETQGNEGDQGTSGNTFEDFLKDGKNQAEFDRRVNKAIETALGNAKVKWQEDADQKAEEAAKVAKMNAEQKQQYEMDKLKKENERLQAESVRNQLSRNAAGVLVEKGIEATQDVLDFVVGVDEADTNARIDTLMKIVESQLKKAEIARATGSTPKTMTNSGSPMSEFEKRLAKYK
jgi:Alanyl-tRNA synthetase